MSVISALFGEANISVKIYEHADGHTACSVNKSWISALFVDKAAALSWWGHWSEAERKFAELNPPIGKGENFLPARIG